MEKKLINGHNQFVFTEEEKKEIYDLFVNHNYSQRKLMRKYGCTQKPMTRVLNELGLNHSRGNLSRFVYNFPDGIYDEKYESEIKKKIESIPSKNQKYHINDHYFDDIRNPEVIYTIGLLYSDGCNHNKQSISISLEETDGYILERINNNMENECKIYFKDYSNKHDFGYHYKDQKCLNVHNERIAIVLDILGVVPRKSLILQFPKWLHPSLYSHFIRGVFDGDGSIYRYFRKNTAPQFVLTITSTEDMCRAIVDICAKYIGINSHIYDASCHNGITKVFSICGRNIVQKMMEWMYKDANIFLLRKYNRYVDYFNINNSVAA